MLAPFMVNAWVVSSVVAVVASVVGFFVVLRGSAFAAHAIPNGAFAGAAGAALVGLNTLVGLGVFAVASALGITWLGRRGRRDVATALALVLMLALGAAFLSQTSEYQPEIFSLLFGEVLGVSTSELVPVGALAAACLLAVAALYRPLLLSSVIPEVAEARGLGATRVESVFLVVLALSTAMTVPVVGALLIFSLMIGPPAAARAIVARPAAAMAASVLIALVTIWLAIACSYATSWPIGFFVGTFSALDYALGRLWASRAEARPARRGLADGASSVSPPSGAASSAHSSPAAR